MDFFSRFITNWISSLITRFAVTPQKVDQFKNDYPLEGMDDHHRFFI